MNVVLFAVNAGLSTLNWVLWVSFGHEPWNLGAGIFCGSVALMFLAMAVADA